MNLSHKADRQLLEEIWHATAGRALKLGDGVGVDDLITKDESAPDPVQPVEGFEKVCGPKPEPKDSTNGTKWRIEATRVTKVYADTPGEYEPGVIELAMKAKHTGVVFLEYLGKTMACIRPGLPPTRWLVPATSFIGSNVEGLIRDVLDAQKKGTL